MFKVKAFAGAIAVCFVFLITLGAIRNLQAQQYNPGVQQFGSVTPGDCTKWGPGIGQIQDAGACGSSAPVSSVFSRTGTVVAALGDYSFSLISGTLSNSQLDTVNANVGAFGGANSIPSFTVNAQGRITAAAANVPAIPFTEVTGSLACGQLPALTGDTTTSAGSCVTNTVKVNGISFAASAAVDTVPVVTSANTATTYTALPNCPSGVLQYTTATHLFSCGTAGTGTLTQINQGNGISLSTSPCTTSCTVSAVAPVVCDIISTSATSCNNGGSAANNGTYTTPAGTLYLEVKYCGGGAGGGGSGSSTGTVGVAGNNTTFGSSLFVGNGGNAPTVLLGGTGGTATGGYQNITGTTGGPSTNAISGGSGSMYGGNSPYYAGGGAPSQGGSVGGSGIANSGGGGSGADSGGTIVSGAGGGGGGCGTGIITSPGASYPYAVAAGVSGGVAGSSGYAGGQGAGGRLTVIAH